MAWSSGNQTGRVTDRSTGISILFWAKPGDGPILTADIGIDILVIDGKTDWLSTSSQGSILSSSRSHCRPRMKSAFCPPNWWTLFSKPLAERIITKC